MRQRRQGLVLVIAVTLLAASIPVASAHAGPLRASPAPGTHVAAPPTEVWIEFNEPIDQGKTTIEVFDANDTRVDTDDEHPSGDNRVAVGLVANLTDGAFLVNWATVSNVDGHPTSGSFGFAIGNATVVFTPPTVMAPPFPWWTAVAKAFSFVGLALLVGLIATRLVILPRALRTAPPFRIHPLALVGAALQVAGLALFLYDGSRTAHDTLRAYAFHNEFGKGVVLRLALAAATLVALAFDRRGANRFAFWAQTVLVLASVVTYGVFSHTAAKISPRSLGGLLDAAHLLAVMAWSGGLAYLFLLLRQARPDLEVAWVEASHRFSRLAMASVAVLTLSGIVMLGSILGWQLAAWRATLGTTYGQLLAYKVFLALVMMGLGGMNHVFFIRRYDRAERLETRPLFVANVRREAINGLLILLVAAALTNLSPVG